MKKFIVNFFLILICFTPNMATAESRVAFVTMTDVFNKYYHQCIEDYSLQSKIATPDRDKFGRKCYCIGNRIFNKFDFSFLERTLNSDEEWNTFHGVWIEELPIRSTKDIEQYIAEKELIYKKRCVPWMIRPLKNWPKELR